MQDSEREFPRLSELRAISVSLNSPDAYFQINDTKFEDPIKKRYFRRIEDDLRGLDADAWDALKGAAAQRLLPTKDRGWQPLFDTLNEAKAYNHLVSIGCTSIAFIPRSRQQRVRTPDLQALSDSVKTFCEVKTINMSADEVERLRSGGVGTTLLTVEGEGRDLIAHLFKYRQCIANLLRERIEFGHDPASRIRKVGQGQVWHRWQ
jgi:hypothetical protein